MKRSRINRAVREAEKAFAEHDWILPPDPRWDVTDFGLDDFERWGLVLVNLSEQREYCEKIMYAQRGQTTPMHYHARKKEDIICRWGKLAVRFETGVSEFKVPVNGVETPIPAAAPLILAAGERVTLAPELNHEFWPETGYALIGEVSTANDDVADNFFTNRQVGRFSEIEKDEEPYVRLVSD
ncbi:MAG: D-lyxose/D-mannose family sugar isomerase [Kiritimatiellia bacterium]